jgi:hypothetical protein
MLKDHSVDHCIRIESRGTSSTVIPLVNDVCRAGSGAKCHIMIPTKSRHALTVYRRGHSIIVLNRTSESIRVGNDALAPGKSVPWNEGKSVLVEKVCLKLQSNSPAMARLTGVTATQALSLDIPEPTQVETSGTASGSGNRKRSNQPMQILVIISCVLLIGLMQWLVNGADDSKDEDNMAFTALTKTLQQVRHGGLVTSDDGSRIQALLGLIARYRLAVTLREKENALLIRDDLRYFCQSISQAVAVSRVEKNAVQKLTELLRPTE